MRKLAVGVALLMAASLAQALQTRADYQPNTLSYRSLANPTSGDEFMFRLAEHQRAQQRSNAIFKTLAPLLGGTAPTLNFVPTGSQFLSADGHTSANIADAPGAPKGEVNIDPYATWNLIDDGAPSHSNAVNQVPHEDAHLRQTPQVLADVPTREGGAQAFADMTAYTAAHKAGIPYSEPYPKTAYDGSYAGYVQQAQARGPQWILAGQFGKTGTPSWP